MVGRRGSGTGVGLAHILTGSKLLATVVGGSGNKVGSHWCGYTGNIGADARALESGSPRGKKSKRFWTEMHPGFFCGDRSKLG